MYSNLVKKFPFKLCASVVVGAIVYKNVREVHDKPNYASGFNYSRKYYPASAEYPDLSKNRNIMARNLTLNLYSRLRDLRTPNGFTIDDAIQTGVDNIGRFSFTGIVAGDTESYDVFKELFDKVILERHNYKPDQLHVTDLDGSKIHDGVLDPNYVVSIRIRAYRNIKGYCFPSFCTRGERRDVESLVAKALFNLEKSYKGTYVSLKDLNQEEEANLVNSNLWMDKPFYPNETSANLGRDWPDARGIWFTDDKTLSTFINRKDHLMINVVDKHSDFKASFIKFANFVKELESEIKSEKWQLSYNKHLGYLTTDPKNLGTGLKMSVRIKLPKLSKDGRLSTLLKMFNLSQHYRVLNEPNNTNQEAESNSIVEVASSITLGKSEVEIAQLFIESVNKLIEAEKLLENGHQLDSLLFS